MTEKMRVSRKTKERIYMGCDINLFLEYKSPITNEWSVFGHGYYMPRNYEMFAKMAGVRSEKQEIIFLPKGFPDNVTEYVNEECEKYKNECHDLSWLSKEEFEFCISHYKNSPIDIIEYRAILASMEIFEKNKIETRIVFWFVY